ncbi:FtsX-like permease family protein [Sphingomonas sp.]|uniref:ABC transporter permease n=1 Tax=Sphingomonas sp. TaxID=28214 RepID=UPI00286C13F5|nr:FtsX-like permease family protein [Sphingomonas sp.]
MSEALRLARRDLRGGLAGLGLLWLCLAIAVAAIASVTSLASSIDGSIASNGRALIGGDLVVRSAQREATGEELAALAKLGRVSKSTTLRAMVNGPNGAIGLSELSSIDPAWPLAGTLDLAPGGTRPHGRQVAIGRELADRLGVARGASVRIGYADFTVSAIVEKMPSISGFAFAPPVLVDPAGLAATGLVQPGSLTSNSYRILLPASTDPQAAGKAFQARFPDGGWSATDRNDAGQGTRRFIDRVAELLLLVVLAALAIGGLGIASAAAAFAESRRTTVATLKLLGAPRATLAAMLALEVAAVALIAVLAGLALGALVPALVGQLAGASLPITLDPAPQWRALGRAALFGTLVTLAAAWGPLAAAIGTRPATLLRGDVGGEGARRVWLVPLVALLAAAALAIASATDPKVAASGLAAIVILAALFAGIGLAIRRAARSLRHRGGPVTRLGIAALDRPGAATVRLSVALGLGLSLLITLATVAQSLLRTIDDDIPTRAPALFLIDLPAAQEARFRALAARTAPGVDLRLVPALRGPVTAINGVPVASLTDIPEGAWILRGDRGLTFASTLPPGNRLTAGQWWPADYRGPPLISLDADAATALHLRVGDSMTVAVLGHPITAKIASLRAIDWRSMGFNFAIIFAPGVLEQAPYSLMATASPPAGASTAQLERTLASDLPMVSAIRVADVIAQLRSLLVALAGAVRIATGVTLLLGVVVLAGAVVATRRARARDLVLLKLVGASRGTVLGTQLVEFALLGTIVTIAAFATGLGAGKLLLGASLDLAFRPDWLPLAALAIGAIVVTVGTALIAAIPALTARPAAALRAL